MAVVTAWARRACAGEPVRVYEGVHFKSYGDAMRSMFKLRWELLTGETLPMGETLELGAGHETRWWTSGCWPMPNAGTCGLERP